jgi:hypothetical protein
LMTGSSGHQEAEAGLMSTLLGRQSAEDGLYWSRAMPDSPWHSLGHDGYKQTDEDLTSIFGNARLMRLLLSLRDLHGDDRFDDRIKGLAQGLDRLAVHVDDYAYYPDSGVAGAFIMPRSGWPSTREPQGDHEGGEGGVTGYQGNQIYALSHWYQASGDESALALAGKLARFCLKAKFWTGVSDPGGVAGAEQGHVDSHFHLRAIALRGLLEYALVTGDDRIKEFVRSSYEYMRTFAIPRMGFISCMPASRLARFCESCTLGDWVALGIRLSEAGVGDYWDDVDQCVRNQLVETQLVRRDLLERVAEDGFDRPAGAQWFWLNEYRSHTEKLYPGQETTEDVIDRSIGLFAGFSTPTALPETWVMQCCVGNATQGLYYAWEGIVRSEDNRHAVVNLLLNRASPWLDITSELPYRGRVVLTIKTATSVAIRLSSWIDRQAIRITVGDQDRPLRMVGNYALISDLRPDDRVVLEFPVVEKAIDYTWMARLWREETVLSCVFRGNTLVDISPRDTLRSSYPIYLRDHLRQGGPAPMRQADRYVAERLIQRW